MPTGPKETQPKKDAPTEAQLAQLAALVDDLGVEAPVIATADEAQSAIEALRAVAEEPEPEPEVTDEPDPEQEAEEEQHAAEEAQARSGAERSDKQTQQMFERAVGKFRDSLRVVFDVGDLQPASAPGVIGFLLPGFIEKKTNDLYQRCPTCNGHGKVLTGSMREGNQEADCPDPRCKGNGYWKKSTAPPPQQPQVVSPVTGPTAYAEPAAQNGNDEWETPSWLGDPNLNAPVQP